MRVLWVAPLLALALPATAAAEQRYVCATETNVERAPANHPIGFVFRGDRFVTTQFARGGTWAKGTGYSYAFERRPVRRVAGWVRVADLCARGAVPWAALPPASGSAGFLGARLAAGPAGVLYLADGGEVLRLSVKTASRRVTLRSRRLGHLRATALATAADGHLYVASADATISVYSPAGKRLRTFGHRGNAKGDLHQVLSLAVSGTGEVFAGDVVNHVTHFSPTGKVLGQWSVRGPVSMTMDRDDLLDVLQGTATPRVSRFAADGTPASHFSVPGGADGQLALGAGGNLLVSGSDGRVTVVSTAGRRVREFGERRKGAGASVAVAAGGTVYLLSDRLRVFEEDGTPVAASAVEQRYSG